MPSFSSHLIGRKDIVMRMARVLQTGKSVILIGQPGVGKKTVIHEFVHRAWKGELDSSLAYSRVLDLNYQAILSGSSDLYQKKVKLGELIAEASHAGNVILVIKDIQRLTSSQVEGSDFTDIIEKALEPGKLKIIAIVSTTDYERFLAKDARISNYFEPIEVVAPNKDEALSILIAFAQRLEIEKKMIITSPALRRVLEGSDKYITDTPFPEKTLELLEEVAITKTDTTPISVDDVNRVLTEKTGISLVRLTGESQEKLSHLEEIIHEHLIDQENAVSLIAKSLRGRTLGGKSEDRPVGSFLFLGPTGVGKTQTAKVLADVYFGDEKSIIRFDMAEFVGPEGVTRLIGSVDKNQPGLLTTEIKNHPASLLLLDEIEKSPPEIFNFFLTLLDEGYLTDASGKKVNCRFLFVIATSNAAAEHIRQLVSKGIKGNALQKDVIDNIQKEGYFSPEFLNRFDGVVVYEPLSPENMIQVARLQLEEFKENLLAKNVSFEITDELCQRLATEGYDPVFGARPMRRIIDLDLSDIVSKGILDGEINPGDHITIVPGTAAGEYTWKKSN
jgi:ATP-dependent Clp protease ATP-binding subunit ClpC